MVRAKQVKSVLNKHKKRDSWFLDDYSVNPYTAFDKLRLTAFVILSLLKH